MKTAKPTKKTDETRKHYNDPLNKWLRDELEKQPDKNGSKLAEHLGMSKQMPSNWITGKTPMPPDYVQEAAKYLGVEVPLYGFGFYPAPMMGTLQYDIWKEGGTQPTGKYFPVLPSAALPGAEYIVYELGYVAMRDNFREGDLITFVKYSDRFKLETGSVVVIERNKLGVIETSLRILSIHDDRKEYRVLDPSKKPLVVFDRKTTGEKVKVLGVFYELTRRTGFV